MDDIILDLFQESLNNKVKPYIFKFRCNAQKFRIHYQAKNIHSGNYPHMGVTAREGIQVLYRIEGNTQWLNVDAYTSRNSPINVNMKYLAQIDQFYEILIYGPVLGDVEILKIEVEDNYTLEVLNNAISNEILIVGGIHSLGIGCTACGVMFSNILGRKYGKHFQNISFNNANHLKSIYDNLDKYNFNNIGTIILELDYIRQGSQIFDEYSQKVIKKLRSKCDNLICWYALPETELEKHSKLDKISKKYLKKKDVHILDLSFIYDEKHSEMCTHSKNYINDAGNIMIYTKLFEQIEEIKHAPKQTTFNDKLRGLKNGILKFNR